MRKMLWITSLLFALGYTITQPAPLTAAELKAHVATIRFLQQTGDQETDCLALYMFGFLYQDERAYEEALDSYAESLTLCRTAGLPGIEGLILQGMANVYFAQRQYDQALDYYQQALSDAKASNDQDLEESILIQIGLTYGIQGQHDEALDVFQKALSMQEEMNDDSGIGSVLNFIGWIYVNQDQYDEALNHFQQSLAIWREFNDKSNEGFTLDNIGNVYFLRSQYTTALDYYEQALTAYRSTDNKLGESSVLINLGHVKDSQGYYTEALEYFRQALSVAQEAGNRLDQGKAFAGIGGAHSNQGHYAAAFENFEQAETVLQEMGWPDDISGLYNMIANSNFRQGQFAEALDYYQRALTIMRDTNDRINEGVVLGNIGAIYNQQGKYTQAMESYQRLLEVAQDIGNRSAEATALTNIGDIYIQLRQVDQALDSFQKALTAAQEVGDKGREGHALYSIGLFYVRNEQHDRALEYLQQALAIFQEINAQLEIGNTYRALGVMYEAQNQIHMAIESYVKSLDILEDIRSSAGSDLARTSFVEDFADIYDRIMALYARQSNIDQAFRYTERGRARTLLDTLATGQVQLSDSEAVTLLAQEREAYAVRLSAENRLSFLHVGSEFIDLPLDSAQVEGLEAALQAAKTAYEQVTATIHARSDHLTSLIPGRQQVLQLADVQALLSADTTLLSYWTLGDTTLAFVITAQDAIIVELPGVTAQSVLTLTESLYQWNNLDNLYPLPLRQLYQALIAPLADKLKTPHLAIIPHQSLHYVPFAALINEAHNKQYLGEQYTLSLLPSASMLPFLQQNATAAQANRTGGDVVFGDPASNEPGLPRLHYAATEASAVANLLNTAVLTDTAARETTLKQAARGARIVHLAAHGAYNQANALYSAIYLAPSSPLTPTQSITATDGLPTVDTSLDGRLETHEIFGLPLKGNDLVVLSACQTNIGNLSRGDEIVGLTRAFFFAGSPTVISSLWNVDDAATEALMVSFYQHWLNNGMSKAAALQAAQADVRANPRWASPFYWAGFVLNGDPGLAEPNK